MPAASSTELSASRYGRRVTPRWVWIAVAVVLIAGGTAWAWWASQAVTDDPVSAQVHSFDVRSDHGTEVTIRVHRPDPGQPVSCEVHTEALDHSVVGERTVEVGPSDQENVFASPLVRTERRAVNASVHECRISD